MNQNYANDFVGETWGAKVSPRTKFKIELVNSKKNGIRGTLPRAFRHLSQISRPNLL